jgi:hypothetical protein
MSISAGIMSIILAFNRKGHVSAAKALAVRTLRKRRKEKKRKEKKRKEKKRKGRGVS